MSNRIRFLLLAQILQAEPDRPPPRGTSLDQTLFECPAQELGNQRTKNCNDQAPRQNGQIWRDRVDELLHRIYDATEDERMHTVDSERVVREKTNHGVRPEFHPET